MTTLSKDEVVKMAREAGAAPEDGVSGFWVAQTEDLQRFATLCRAPLVAEVDRLKQAHEINADTMNAMQVEIDDWKARALKAEQAGDRAVPDAEDYNLIDRYLRNNLDDADYGEYLAALDRLVTPQPAAQEPTSAAPVVRQMVVALEDAQRAFSPAIHVGVSSAIAAGQKFIKESGK